MLHVVIEGCFAAGPSWYFHALLIVIFFLAECHKKFLDELVLSNY